MENSNNIFSPQLKNLNRDNLSGWLQTVARNIFIVVFGLLPIFFIPNSFAILGFTKSYFVAMGVFAVLVLFSLSVLRRGEIKFSISATLLLFWSFVLIMLASALLSGDRLDAIVGNNLEVHTVGFFVLLGAVMTVSIIFGESKSALAKLLLVSGGATIILLLFHILRLFFGPEFWSFGLFNTNTASLFGSFNDLAIFFGLVVIVILLLVQNLSTTLLGRITMITVLLLSLLILAIVNFFIVWLVVGLFSLLMLLYVLSKDTWLKNPEEEQKPVSRLVISAIALVVVSSFAFIISGNYLGYSLSNLTGINYLEVRPSVGATFDIVGAIYKNDALLGIGANRFEDAWRLYKDPVINQTNFWSTDFTAGSGLVPTLFATSGLAGGTLFVLFLLSFLYIGYRTLFSVKLEDSRYLVGIVTFVSAVYLWFMAIMYVPGASVMLLTALMTGLTLAIYSTTGLGKTIHINVINNRKQGLILIILVLAIIIAVSSAIFGLSKQYLAQVNYADTVRASVTSVNIQEIDQMLQKSEQLFPQDIFVAERARLRLSELNRLLALPEPTEVDQQVFQASLVEGLALAEQAISLDATNPFNYALLASFYGVLNENEASEIKTRKEAAFSKARFLDPTNPSYLVLIAQLEARNNDLVSARTHLVEAVALKNNYTDALFLLSRLDIQEGKTDDAIAVTKSIIGIEPSNPTRYFQLGVLQSTLKKTDEAIRAFEQAVALDNNYANARYFLALNYLEVDRKEDAMTQLKIVQITNFDNAELKNLINQIESGELVKPSDTFAVPVADDKVVETKDEVTTSSEVPKTDLIKPLNQNNVVDDKSSEAKEVSAKTSTSSTVTE